MAKRVKFFFFITSRHQNRNFPLNSNSRSFYSSKQVLNFYRVVGVVMGVWKKEKTLPSSMIVYSFIWNCKQMINQENGVYFSILLHIFNKQSIHWGAGPFLFCKGHSRWEILKYMGNFWGGTSVLWVQAWVVAILPVGMSIRF